PGVPSRNACCLLFISECPDEQQANREGRPMEGVKYMRGRKLIAVALAASLWLGGYASYAYGWEPVIDLRMDSAIATQDRDLAECRELASRASGDTMTEVAKGTVMGALGGAAFGAMIGGVSGHAGTGAAYGA